MTSEIVGTSGLAGIRARARSSKRRRPEAAWGEVCSTNRFPEERAAERAAADQERSQAKAAKRAKYETEGHYTDGDRITVNLTGGSTESGLSRVRSARGV